MKKNVSLRGICVVLLAACTVTGAGFTAAPVQMLTGTAARQDVTASMVFVELVPTPSQVFSTTAPATLTAMLVTECRVSSAGQRLEVRIKVDNLVADPGVAVLTANSQYETHSHLAFKTQIPAGRHKVTVEWRVSGGQGYVRNRSFTVWEVR
jgi:hypothetical protein